MENTSQGAEINQDNVMDLVNKTLSIRENKALADSNAKAVAAKFTAEYGDKAEATYNSIAKELNVTITKLNELASTSPTLVLKAAGLTATVPPVGNSSSDINTEALGNSIKPELISAKVESGSTKDLLKAWGRAGEKIKQQS
jgi:hypothetical protein